MVRPRCHAVNSVVNQHVPGAFPSRMVRPRCHAISSVVNQNVPAPLLRGWLWPRCQAINSVVDQNVPAPCFPGWYGCVVRRLILWSISMFRAFPSRMVWYVLQPKKWDGRSGILPSSHFKECGDNRGRHVVLLVDGEVKVRPRRQGLMSPTPVETCLLQPPFKQSLYNHTDNRDSRPL